VQDRRKCDLAIMRSETKADLASKAIVPSAVRNEPLIHASCPAVKTSELDQDQPAVSRNLHRTEVKPEEIVSVVFGPAVLIASLMSVSQIPTPRAISKESVLEAHEKEKRRNTSGLPRATSYFHSIRGLHRWPNRQGSENLAEEAIHPIG
jgi:hypothetical protein